MKTPDRRSFCFSKHHHDSKDEAAYCNWLLSELQARRILSFKVWPSIELKILRKRWKADFEVTELDGTRAIHESKGWNRSDDNFRNKLRACLIEYPDLKVYVNKRLVNFTPAGRIIIRPARPKASNLIRTYSREEKRWIVMRKSELLKRA